MAKHSTVNEPDKASQPTSQESQSPNFHPDHITLDTFHHLLTCYPVTVEALARRKARERAARSSSAKSKKARKSNPVREGRGEKKQQQRQQDDRDTAQTEQEEVDAEVRGFLTLDERRYRGLPMVVREREDGDGGGHLTKEELVEVMEWKLKHGVSRPMLLGMVKGNQEKVVQKATLDAFAAAPKIESEADGDDDDDDDSDGFPKASLDLLTGPLRGVGPATASLLLAVGTAARDAVLEVPFYSDDSFLWLCLGVVPAGRRGRVQGGDDDEESARQGRKKQSRAGVFKPNGEINVKYNVQEYRRLWDAVRELRNRLNAGEESGRRVSCADVEKVALVLRHLDVSPFFEDETETKERKRKRSEKTD